MYTVIDIHTNKQVHPAPFADKKHALAWAQVLMECDRIKGRHGVVYALQWEHDGRITVMEIK